MQKCEDLEPTGLMERFSLSLCLGLQNGAPYCCILISVLFTQPAVENQCVWAITGVPCGECSRWQSDACLITFDGTHVERRSVSESRERCERSFGRLLKTTI